MLRLGLLSVAGATVATLACSRVPARPTMPQSSFHLAALDFSSADANARQTMWTYAPAANTENPITRDRVMVEVTPIVDGASAIDSYREDVLVECRTPTDVPMYMSAVGFGVRLGIQDGTGHIIRTGSTSQQTESVLQVEDGQGHAWPLVQGDWRDWVPRVVQGVQAKYACYLELVAAWATEMRAQIGRHTFVPASYAPEYQRFRAEWDACMSNIMDGRTEERCGSRIELEAMSPQGLETRLRQQAEAQVQQQEQQARTRIEEFARACATAIEQKAEALSPGTLVTEQTFAQLRILTDQTVALYVPLDPDFRATGSEAVVLRLYDLVTDTNAAGVPTRRTNFQFRLERREQTP